MKRKTAKTFLAALGTLTAFALWTVVVLLVDVQAIGPNGSAVGLATINNAVHSLFGVHMSLYTITDWLGLVPVGVGFGFAVLGLVQWISRRHILKVDFSILVLGGFYLVVLAAYLLFESVVINYRPILINGYLEASYPSSTTMLVLCVMPTAVMQLKPRIKSRGLLQCVTAIIAAFTVFMVIGRVISGVHWLTDIVGGCLLSTGLVLLYDAVSHMQRT